MLLLTYDFEYFNITLAAIMLLFTSYLDIKRREVEDKVWIGFGAAGIAMQAFEIYIGYTNPIQLLVSVGIAAIIGLGIFFFGLYGGADGKALIVLGVMVPIFHPVVGIYDLAPIMTLTNGILLSILLPIGLAFYNAIRLIRGEDLFSGFEQESLPRKLLALFLGYRTKGMPRDFQFPMEKDVTEEKDGVQKVTKKFDFGFLGDEFETKPQTWVTPGIPLLVFFTAGFFLLLIYGDLVIGLVQFVARAI